ncbi:MAG TPA: ribonuclease Z [Chloroflexota bacterium]|nr:ribonuclease Z [Chloroflexota bacterium]
MLDVYLLGEGGTMPLPGRWLSSVLVRHEGRLLLLDCGEGTQVPLRAAGWGLRAIDTICITHFHGDHVGGLPGLLLTLGNAERREPLTIFGPPGLAAVVAGLRVIAPYLPYEVVCRELAGGERFALGSLQVACLAMDHSVPCLSYTLERPRGRPFEPERARALGLPLPLWGRLQRGETVTWEGRAIPPDAVLGPPRPGVKLAFVTDTRPIAALPGFVAGASLLICEGMYGGEEDLPRALENKHMLFAEAATIAREGGVAALWLTHFSPALTAPADYLPAARAIFPNTRLGATGLTTTLSFPDD